MIPVYLDMGQKCWIHTGDTEMDEGVVVHIFKHFNVFQYVVEVDTHVDPVLYVRSVFLVSDDKNKPIGVMRR